MLADGRLLGGVDRDWMDGSFCVQEGDGCRTGALYRVRRCGALWSEWMLCCNLTVAPPRKQDFFRSSVRSTLYTAAERHGSTGQKKR